jgi:uncharacterized protein (UPF0333 family)
MLLLTSKSGQKRELLEIVATALQATSADVIEMATTSANTTSVNIHVWCITGITQTNGACLRACRIEGQGDGIATACQVTNLWIEPFRTCD